MKVGKWSRKIVAILLCLILSMAAPLASIADELETPTPTGAVANGNGIKFTWSAVAGAEGYRVYRKTAGTNWTGIANNVADTSYQDNTAAENTVYTYTVRALKGGATASGYNTTGVSGSWTSGSGSLAKPQMVSAVANGSGIQVSWNAVLGVDGYRVYRKSAGTNWVGIANNVTSTSYQDNTAQEGVTYTYTARCMKNGAVVSEFDSVGVSAAWTKDTAGYLATPGLVSAASEATGIRVKWGKVTGATGYRIYRKTATTNWAGVANVGDVAEYLDNAVTANTAYTYTVRCLKAGNVVSDFDKKGVTATWGGSSGTTVTAPKLTSATAEGSGIRVAWDPVSGINSYRLYRKTTGTNWVGVANVAATSFLDNATESGKVYTYTVRCLDAAGNPISGYDAKGIDGSWVKGNTGPLAIPALKSVTVVQDTLRVTWEAVSGASGYRLYRRTDGSTWTGVANVAGTSYDDAGLASGTKYIYTVRALDAAGTPASGYDPVGMGAVFYNYPKLQSTASVENGIQLKWGAVGGAPMYLIWRKPAGGTYARYAYTTDTQFVDTGIAQNTQYIYTVAVVSADQSTVLSDHDLTGIAGMYIGKAAVSALTVEDGDILVQWGALAGAAQYRLFRKYGAGGWTTVTTTAATNYVDANVVNGITYTYQVRAMDSAGNYIGTYDETGKSITYYVKPTLDGCTQESSGLRTTWQAVAGVGNYVVYRKIAPGTEWFLVGMTANTYYLDTTMPSGTLCFYTVACADAAGNPISARDAVGVGVTSYMDIPVLVSAECIDTGITVTWNPVDKATQYHVYYKTGDKTDWVHLAYTGNVTSYTHTGLTPAETYTYTVATFDGWQDASEYNATGVTATFYPVPTLTGIKNDKTGVTTTWNAVDGIGSYQVYRKTGSTGWTAYATVNGTSYTDTAVQTTGHYWYSVSCMKDSREVSGYDQTGLDIVYYAAPQMTEASNRDGAIYVAWSPVEGIAAYRVYRRAQGENWAAAVTWDVAATSFTDNNSLAAGTKYEYTVRCLQAGNVVSEFNSTKTIVCLPKPVITVTSPSGGKVHVAWTKIPGADSYEVYRRTAQGTLSLITTVGDVDVLDEANLPSGTVYYYALKARRTDGSLVYTSVYSAEQNVTVK